VASSAVLIFGVNDLVRILEDVASAPFFELLKRPDELEVIKRILNKPRFVEDCVREAAVRVSRLCKDLPKESLIRIDYESLFPLAKYHVIARLESTLRDLKSQVSF